MADPYTMLGLSGDPSDAEVRAAYLRAVREYPPEQHPVRAVAIRTAYEAIKSVDARARHRLFPPAADDSLDAVIEEVRCRTTRHRFTLAQLLTATGR